MSLKKAVKSLSTPRRVKKTPQGQVGFDNARENIDPHIKTKVVSAKEYSGAVFRGGSYLGADISMSGHISGATYQDVNIDHDALTNFVVNEHIDWTNTSSNLDTTGTVAVGASNVTQLQDKRLYIDSGDNFYLDHTIVANSPLINFDSNDNFRYVQGTDKYMFIIGGQERFSITGTTLITCRNDLISYTDGVSDLGGTSNRWQVLYLYPDATAPTGAFGGVYVDDDNLLRAWTDYYTTANWEYVAYFKDIPACSEEEDIYINKEPEKYRERKQEILEKKKINRWAAHKIDVDKLKTIDELKTVLKTVISCL